MDLLHPGGGITGHAQLDVAFPQQYRHIAAIPTGQGDDEHLPFMGGPDGPEQIG